MGWGRLAAAGLALGLAGCGGLAYRDAPEGGSFSGSLVVVWLGEGSASAGDGRFLFMPVPNNELTFTRADGAVIRPGLMYTDGGSVPKFAQLFKGFGPWGYAPAYMVHDWLFTAKHCAVDGRDAPDVDLVRSMSLEESAQILGEAIKALMRKRYVAPDDLAASTITYAVGTPVARKLWEEPGRCDADKVSDADRRRAEALLAQEPAKALARRRGFVAPGAPPRGGVVATFSF